MLCPRSRTPTAYRKPLLHDPPQLLRHGIAGKFDLQVTPLVRDLLRGVRPAREAPSRILPPLLQRLHLILEVLLFGVHACGPRECGLDVGGEDGRDLGGELLESFSQDGLCLGGLGRDGDEMVDWREESSGSKKREQCLRSRKTKQDNPPLPSRHGRHEPLKLQTHRRPQSSPAARRCPRNLATNARRLKRLRSRPSAPSTKEHDRQGHQPRISSLPSREPREKWGKT